MAGSVEIAVIWQLKRRVFAGRLLAKISMRSFLLTQRTSTLLEPKEQLVLRISIAKEQQVHKTPEIAGLGQDPFH